MCQSGVNSQLLDTEILFHIHEVADLILKPILVRGYFTFSEFSVPPEKSNNSKIGHDVFRLVELFSRLTIPSQCNCQRKTQLSLPVKMIAA